MQNPVGLAPGGVFVISGHVGRGADFFCPIEASAFRLHLVMAAAIIQFTIFGRTR
jgi:hypothetical protein